VELPTLMLIVIAYGGWLALTAAYDHWPLWVVAPAVVVLLTLHSSLQHEIIHGHPTVELDQSAPRHGAAVFLAAI